MLPLKYVAINDYEQVNHYYKNKEIVTQPIEFVSALSRIRYMPNDQCIFYFDNFSMGRKNLQTYAATLSIKTVESSTIFELMFSLLSEKLELDPTDIDFSRAFELNNLENDRISLCQVKGLLSTGTEKGTLKLHKLQALDLEKFFNDPTSTEIIEHKTKIDKILKNLLKLETKCPNFKLTSLKNFSSSMKKYMYDNKLSRNIINPLFHQALLTRVQEDTQNDFDSQTQTQSQTQAENCNESFPSDDVSFCSESEKGKEFVPDRQTDRSFEISSSLPEIHGESNFADNSSRQHVFSTPKEDSRKHRSAKIDQSPKNKKIKLTDLGAVKKGSSSHNVTDTGSANVSKLFEKEIRDPSSIVSLEFGQTACLKDIRIVGYDQYGFQSLQKSSTHNSLLLYVYCYKMPLFGACFFPELNCFEIVVTDIEALFSSLSFSRNDPEDEKLNKFREVISNYKVDMIVEKQQKRLRSVYSAQLICKAVSLKQKLNHHQLDPITVPANKTPIVTVDQIVASEVPHYYTIFALGVTTKYTGSKSVVFSFTDFTSNSLNNYGFDSFVGSFAQRLPPTQHVHAVMYLNKVESVNEKLRTIIKMNLHDCADKGNSNITHRGLIFRFTVKCQLFKGKLNTVIFDAIPITPETPLSSEEYSYVSRLRTTTLAHMSSEAMNLYMLTIRRFLPIERDSKTGQFKLSERHDMASSENLEFHSDDPVKRIEQEVKHNGDPEFERLEASKPDKLTVTRINKVLDIPMLKSLQHKGLHNNCILNLKLIDFEYSPERVIFYGIDSAYSKTFINDPVHDLIVLQLCGAEKLKMFFNDNDYQSREYDLSKCLGSNLQVFVTAKRQKISKYLCIHIWQPLYLTYESLILHRTMELQENGWKSEEFSELL